MAVVKRKRNLGKGSESGLDISSLIDVSFLLLIYFVVSSSIMATEQDVNMELPDVSPVQLKREPLFIKVNQEGVILMGAGSNAEVLDSDLSNRSVPLLSQRLEAYKMGCDLAGESPMIQMGIHGDATQQRVLDCINALSKHDIRSVTFTDLVD